MDFLNFICIYVQHFLFDFQKIFYVKKIFK